MSGRPAFLSPSSNDIAINQNNINTVHIKAIRQLAVYKLTSRQKTQNMEHCDCNLRVQFCCPPNPYPHHHCRTTNTNYMQNQTNNEAMYHKIADTLQSELRKQSVSKDQEMDSLREQVSKMRVQILKLESRNKLDRENQKRLESQLSQLKESKSREHSSIVQPEPEIRQVVKEVFIRDEDPSKDKEFKRAKQRNRQLAQHNAKLTYELEKFRNQNAELAQQMRFQRDKCEKYRHVIKDCQGEIERLKRKLKQAEDYIEDMETKVSTLEAQSRKVIVEEREKIVYKPETKVETVYIEKPIEKLVYVDVPRTVKEFVEPPKPVVNRIVDCSKQCSCDDDQDRYTIEEVEQIKNSYGNAIRQLENNIDSYQRERQQLMNAIRDRDSDLSQLQSHLRMISKSGSRTAHSSMNQPTQVTVTVHKQKDEEDVRKELPATKSKGMKAPANPRPVKRT